MTTLPNGLTVNTDVGKVAWPTCSKTMSGASPRMPFTCLANARETLKRSFSSSADSPPRRIMPAYSLRSMKSTAPRRFTSSPFSADETTPTALAPEAAQSWVANTPRPPAAPQMRTLCPAWSLHWSMSMR